MKSPDLRQENEGQENGKRIFLLPKVFLFIFLSPIFLSLFPYFA